MTTQADVETLITGLNLFIAGGLSRRTSSVHTRPAWIVVWDPFVKVWSVREVVPAATFSTTLSDDELLLMGPRELIDLTLPRLRALTFAPAPAPPPPIEVRGEVTIPFEIRQVLHRLQQRPDGTEYGGGIDFEVLGGRAEVERLVAFLGDTGTVPLHLFRRFASDVEVGFHTHPKRQRAGPSLNDMLFFEQTPQRTHIIVAAQDLLMLTKKPSTQPVRTKDNLCSLADGAGVEFFGFERQTLEQNVKVDDFLRDTLGWEVLRVPRRRPGPLPLEIKVVQQPSRGTIQ